MKKLKQIFSFMLVGILLITGSTMLTGCFKKEEKSEDKNIETAITVFTNLKNIYLELEAMAETCVGEEIPEIENSSIKIFDDYGVYDSMNNFSILDSDYVEEYYNPGKLGNVSRIGLALINVANFEFGRFYSFDEIDGDGELAEYAMSLEFSSSKIRIVTWNQFGIGSDIIVGSLIIDVYYNDVDPLCIEFISIDDEDNYLSYEKIVMSTHEGIGLNYVIEFETTTDMVDLDIYSEAARKKAHVSGNLTTMADVIEITQAKRTQLLETANYDWDEISKTELSETDKGNMIEAMF